VRGVEIAGRIASRQRAVAVQLDAGLAGGGLGGEREFAWQEGQVVLQRATPEGGTLSLRLEGRNVAGAAPVQEVADLGGDATLRGYERFEFAGRRRATARVEHRFGIDLLARTRLPLLRTLRLQFIPFFDAGTTWGALGGVDGSRGDLDGALQSSFGLGFERQLWLPGLEALRLDVARRTDGGGGVSLWLRVVPLGL
jgi:hypothetical protein